MALWTVHGDGHCPERDDAVIGCHERPSWWMTVGFGVQHLLAMFGATIMVPLLVGLPVTATLLMSGLGTLLFLLLTRNRVPTCVGASYAFVVPLGAAASQGGAGPAALLGGVLVVGLVVFAVGVAVKALGVRLLESAMPPVVAGAIVLMLGLSAAPQVGSFFDQQPMPAAVAAGAMLFATVLGRGVVSRMSVLIGVVAGLLAAVLAGQLAPNRVDAVGTAAWFAMPDLLVPQVNVSVVQFVLPTVIVLVAMHVGHVKALASMTGRDLDGSVGDALIGAGLATSASACAGGTGMASYGENLGVMAATRVYSTAPCALAGVVVVGLAFSPKAAAVLNLVPLGVLGGVSLVLLGMVALVGARMWAESGVDVADPVNMAVLGTALVAAVGNLTLRVGDIEVTGLVWGSAGIVFGYPVLRKLADGVEGRRRSSFP